MYNNKILMTEKTKVTEEDLKDIEETYNFVFPKSFIRHYLKYNGGRPERNLVIHKEKQDDFIPFTYFYAIKSDDGEDGIELKRMLKTNFDEDSIFPKWLVSFADDGMGGEYCWSLREEEYGAIYYWDCDVNLGDDPSKSDEYTMFLADSLEEFINEMVEDED